MFSFTHRSSSIHIDSYMYGATHFAPHRPAFYFVCQSYSRFGHTLYLPSETLCGASHCTAPDLKMETELFQTTLATIFGEPSF